MRTVKRLCPACGFEVPQKPSFCIKQCSSLGSGRTTIIVRVGVLDARIPHIHRECSACSYTWISTVDDWNQVTVDSVQAKHILETGNTIADEIVTKDFNSLS
jgi:hypothetical protein